MKDPSLQNNLPILGGPKTAGLHVSHLYSYYNNDKARCYVLEKSMSVSLKPRFITLTSNSSFFKKEKPLLKVFIKYIVQACSHGEIGYGFFFKEAIDYGFILLFWGEEVYY